MANASLPPTIETKTEEKSKDPTKRTHISQVVQLERYDVDMDGQRVDRILVNLVEVAVG